MLPYTLNIRGRIVDFSVPKIMTITNLTPDSFYSASRISKENDLLKKIEHDIQQGADIIDIGAYSTRPAADYVSEGDEMERLKIPLELIRKAFPNVIISLDTFRAGIAKWAVENFEVDIINDIGGGDMDEKMFETAAELKVPYILMHMRGNPQTMSQMTNYENIMAEMLSYFQVRIDKLIHLGVKDIIVDPGFGFAKTLEQNYEVLAKTNYFKELGFPILCGVSRKTMIHKLIGITPEESLNGTTVLNTVALMNGANILRVHDTKEALEAIKIVEKIKNYTSC